MSDVPEEIWLDVLSRLHVVDLLRFRCVAKPWKCLIDSNEFIRHHFNHTLQNSSSSLKLILENGSLYSADFNLLNETNLAHFQQLPHPLKTKLCYIKVLGSCHGLLALSNYPYYNTTMLWNPFVRRFHELPYESFEFLDIMYMSHGFGYDAVSDDYKLVRMVQAHGNADLEVRVYSLKSDSWRRIPDLPDHIKHGFLGREIPQKFFNGALHWIVFPKTISGDNLVIAFDLGTEEFRLVPLPKFAVNYYSINIFVLGGCLGFMIEEYVNCKPKANFFVMKEYGVQESWSVLFTFDLKCDNGFMRPIAYSKCNRKVLIELDDGVLMWYDLDKKSTDFPMVHEPVDESYGNESYGVESYGMCTCMQSLVLLNSGTSDFDL